MAKTVVEVLNETVAEHGALPGLMEKRGASWVSRSWREYREQASLAARGFMKLGLDPGQCVAIIGYNRPEWLLADIGAILAGGIPAGIYTTSSPEQCAYIAGHAAAPIVVVEDRVQLAKFIEIRDQLPCLKSIVLMTEEPAEGEEFVHSFQDLLDLGKAVSMGELSKREEEQSPDDTATLIYTSGTTGPPKAVMISHKNLTFTAEALQKTLNLDPGGVVISYLPLSHIAEQIISVHAPMLFAGCTAFAESIPKLPENLREVRPHIFFAVPRVWEKIQAKMTEAGASASPLKKKLVAWARRQGLRGGYKEQRGEPLPVGYYVADRLVFGTVRRKLGLDRCKIRVTAAAPISRSTLEFFLSLGLPIYEVYGMSECTGPATVSYPGHYVTGKTGTALVGTELRIAEDGEILIRGDHVFKGYMKNEEATGDALDEDGWLHSGDIGTIDERGFLQITDRKKDLLITAGGENVAPQLIEGALKAIRAVANAVVVGDRRKYLAALLTLDGECLRDEIATAGSPAKDNAEAARCPVFKAYMERQVELVNEGLARVQTIKKFSIIPSDFTIEGGELTPTMKVKRKVVNEKYAREIEALYQS